MIENTSSMSETAVLLMHGCELEGAVLSSNGHTVVFQVGIPPEKEAEAKGLLKQCRAAFDLDVNLGEYEQALKQVRRAIDRAKGARQHD